MYGFEHLQNALSLLHKAGNRKILNDKTGKEYGVPELHLRIYAKLMGDLYSAAVSYEEAYFAVPMDVAVVSERVKPLRDAWAEILKCSSDASVKIKPEEPDLVVIATFASKFVNSEVNFDLADKWTCAKTTANTTPAAFQKSVETLVGIRVDGTARLSDILRDYTEDAGSIASNVKSGERKIKALESEISALKAEAEAQTELPVKNYLDRAVKKKEDELTAAKKVVEELKKSLEEMRGMTPEAYAQVRSERERAEVQRRREKREKARAEKKEQRASAASEESIADAAPSSEESASAEKKPAKGKTGNGKRKSGKPKPEGNDHVPASEESSVTA